METLLIIKVSILPKLIHKFNIIEVTFSPFFEDLDKLILKSYGKVKGQQKPIKSRRKKRGRAMGGGKRDTLFIIYLLNFILTY